MTSGRRPLPWFSIEQRLRWLKRDAHRTSIWLRDYCGLHAEEEDVNKQWQYELFNARTEQAAATLMHDLWLPSARHTI